MEALTVKQPDDQNATDYCTEKRELFTLVEDKFGNDKTKLYAFIRGVAMVANLKDSSVVEHLVMYLSEKEQKNEVPKLDDLERKIRTFGDAADLRRSTDAPKNLALSAAEKDDKPADGGKGKKKKGGRSIVVVVVVEAKVEVVVVEAIGAATTTRAASKAMALVEATVPRASGNGGGPTRRRSKAPARAKARVMAKLQILLIGSPMAPATGGSQRRGPSSGTQSRRQNGRPTTRTRTPPTAWRRCLGGSIYFLQLPPR